MMNKLIILGATAMVYYKPVKVACGIIKNSIKLIRVFTKNKVEEEIIEIQFVK